MFRPDPYPDPNMFGEPNPDLSYHQDSESGSGSGYLYCYICNRTVKDKKKASGEVKLGLNPEFVSMKNTYAYLPRYPAAWPPRLAPSTWISAHRRS